MKTKHTLFVKVNDYYADLVDHLPEAQEMISMTCLAFEDGSWGQRMADGLIERAKAGVQVRLMVDELGQITDDPKHFMTSYKILNYMRENGVQVDVFHPRKEGLSIRNRLHCKFCAIDSETLFIGGSNVGDYYTTWSDTNIRVEGALGQTMHQLYDELKSCSCKETSITPTTGKELEWVGDDRLQLNAPGSRLEIRKALLDLILNARKSIHIRTWYFLPDEDILNALCSQAEKGVKVHVLISDRTRIRPVDLANNIHIRKLVNAGGLVYRYKDTYMHAKAAWNEQGTSLVGSANLDPHSMGINFECCLQIEDRNLAWNLQMAFELDLRKCELQTNDTLCHQTLSVKFLSQTCNLVSPWL
ncbi:MAG: phospholipase D-like domain-containing protein [Anaerolineales bacterium]